MPDKAWKHPLIARLICTLFGHRWQPSLDHEQHVAMPDDPGDIQPWGVFVRCTRCGQPDPYWPFDWYPDEKEAGDA